MNPSEHETSPLDRLASELAQLGAETRTERRVKHVLPWVLSLALHLGIVLLAVLITWTVVNFPAKDESVLIIADFNALQYEPVARLDADPNPASDQPLEDHAQFEPIEQVIDQAFADAQQDAQRLLNASAAASSVSLSQFAPQPNRSGATFVGLSSSNAKKIVYVIDASGSMIANIQTVIQELARSLENLSAEQSFSIIFFQGNNAIELPPQGKLIPATGVERVRSLKWVNENVVPAGGTNPLVAIEKALRLKPDVIFLLSQDITGYGQFEVDQQDLMTLLDQMNPKDGKTGRRLTQINCIQFLEPDRLKAMEQIAREHGGPGGYKFLSRQDLGL